MKYQAAEIVKWEDQKVVVVQWIQADHFGEPKAMIKLSQPIDGESCFWVHGDQISKISKSV